MCRSLQAGVGEAGHLLRFVGYLPSVRCRRGRPFLIGPIPDLIRVHSWPS